MGSPAQSQNKAIFRKTVSTKISCHVPEKNMAEAVRCNMASSDWLKLAALCLFRAQSGSKKENKSICDCVAARPQSERSALLSNSLLYKPLFS